MDRRTLLPTTGDGWSYGHSLCVWSLVILSAVRNVMHHTASLAACTHFIASCFTHFIASCCHHLKARDREGSGDQAWATRTFPQIRLLAQYTMSLFNFTSGARQDLGSGVGAGLIWGAAEHDTCAFKQHWFSVSAWAWRGLVALTRFLADTSAVAPDQGLATNLTIAAANLRAALNSATNESLVMSLCNADVWTQSLCTLSLSWVDPICLSITRCTSLAKCYFRGLMRTRD